MGSGCGNATVEKFPSSSGQLPVPVALNAASPTLFRSYYTRFCRKCKYFFPVNFYGMVVSYIVAYGTGAEAPLALPMGELACRQA